MFTMTDVSLMITAIIFAIPLLALGVARGFQRRDDARRVAEAYHEALVLGLATTPVERDLPQFTNAATRVAFLPGHCARSSIPLRRGSTIGPRSWSFRVEHRRGGLAGDGWWHLREEDGDLPQPVVDILQQEIERVGFDGGFVEFAGTHTEVVAWWDAGGGREEARRIATALRQVARLLDRRSFTPRSLSAVS